ncbi:MAG TPA: HEAT repeat domain-containing protein [Gemmatimonadaceae bacterium]|nr:HEAT repeat domain-containing protein [Gemmatimonadaceae bacterium]
MKTLLAAAIVISSAGLGLSQAPAFHSPIDSVAVSPAPYSSAAAEDISEPELDGNVLPPEPWAQRDPADSLYRLAREALSRNDFKRAAEIFHRITERYPQSAYAGQSLYYEAFSLYRSGNTGDLEQARDLLKTLRQRFPSLANGGDAKTLVTRVCGELAKRGDQDCAREIAQQAEGPEVASGPTLAIPPGRSCPSEDDENDDRIAAINALLQMDAERAMPILKKVLARRDGCSVGLRRKAVFLVSQKHTPETADILMSVARNDPDQEVREQAVFWLSQVPGERPITLLDEILKSNANTDLKEKALFALSQKGEGRAQAILRDIAGRESENVDLRDKAIFWLGQRRAQENTDFLRGLYGRIANQDLKEKILFSLSQQKGVGNDRWLMDIAVNPRESIELRKKALFWAGQTGVATSELANLYNRMTDAEMKDQIIFVFSQRGRDPAAMDKMFEIARTDRDPELRKKAIFWLGQSRDPRAQKFLEDLINQ